MIEDNIVKYLTIPFCVLSDPRAAKTPKTMPVPIISVVSMPKAINSFLFRFQNDLTNKNEYTNGCMNLLIFCIQEHA